MPAIIVEMSEMTKNQKAQMVKEFTESASNITGIPKEGFYVFIKENKPDNVGVGGVLQSDRKK